MKRSFDFEHVLLFKKRRSECRRILLLAKRQCWENFCASLDMRANAKKVWKVARTLSGNYNWKPFPDLVTTDGVITSNQDKANAIAGALAERSASYNYPYDISSHDLVPYSFSSGNPSSRESEYPLDEAFTIAELQSAISTRKMISPGENKICYAQESIKKRLKTPIPHL